MNGRSVSALTRQRCFRHLDREAAARCPECGRYFCRECITEHEDRVLCVSCLETKTAAEGTSPAKWPRLTRLLQSGIGLFAAWIFFYYLGRILLSLPTAFHEGTLWKAGG